MTEREITDLGPAFAAYLRRFRGCFRQDRTAAHFDTYCRGSCPTCRARPSSRSPWPPGRPCGPSRSSSPRPSGTTPPPGPLGTVGVIDETSCRKWGEHTPGVRRQHLGCVGKIDNGIVTVHVGVVRGTFQALLDADLYLPESWDRDRDRCRDAGGAFPRSGTPARSSGTTSGGTSRRPSRTRSSGIDASSKAALYC
jgi:hypothetical protein